MHVFRLSSFESDACGSEPAALSRQNLKEQRLERTKGTHLYAVSRLGCSHLRVVCNAFKKEDESICKWDSSFSDVGRKQHHRVAAAYG